MEKRDCQVNVRIPCRLKEMLEALAEKEHRRLSDVIVMALEAHTKNMENNSL
ncbi:MAG: hypothetical protein ABW078_08935 [Sedimenticola sp.]